MEATRRAFLGGIAAVSIPAPVLASRLDGTPTREELEHYYSFLWLEFIALSKEMGVELHSNYVMHRSGGRDAYHELCKTKAPSTRARAVLAIRNA